MGLGDAKLGLGHGLNSLRTKECRLILRHRADLDARTIVEKSLNIAADICIYTNRNLTIEELK